MPDRTERFEGTIKFSRVALIGTVSVLAMAIIASVAMTVAAVLEGASWQRLTVWLLSIVVESVAAMWVFVAYGIIRLMAANELAVSTSAIRLERIEALLADQSQATGQLASLASLPDRTKSLVFHEHEMEVLNEAVHEDFIKQDYRAAEALIDNIESKFGFREEADNLRMEMATSKKATLDEKVDVAVSRIEDIINNHDWPRATRSAGQLLRAFPDSVKIAALPGHIVAARAKHKRQLLEAYGQAVEKKDLDKSIELLSELDRYLTTTEAEALEDSARGVFKAKLHNMGVQFAICVTDERWAEAVEVGKQIVESYPNSRMAK